MPDSSNTVSHVSRKTQSSAQSFVTKDVQKKQLRKHFRRLRRSLSPTEQTQNAQALLTNLLSTALLLRYQTFALYQAADGEIDTKAITAKLWEYGKATALPVLLRQDYSFHKKKRQMQFVRFTETTPLVSGAYNLQEPAPINSGRRSAMQECATQIIFLPLVAYDVQGTRLGMGGGYYDRYTAHPNRQNILRIGLAHSVQEAVEPLPNESWDKPLDGVITNVGSLAFNRRAAALLGSKAEMSFSAR